VQELWSKCSIWEIDLYTNINIPI